MSAHEQMRQMLDQLMGTGRNGDNNRRNIHFSDHRVCRSFLLNCCPHAILAATRADLGECSKIHDLALRADFEAAAKKNEYNYEKDAVQHLQSFIDDCNRRTEIAKKRLAESQEVLSAEVAAKLNKVHELGEQIGKKLAMAEKAGAEGNVEESLKLMEEVEEIRKNKFLAEQEYKNSIPASSYQQQKLRVCEVCSAYLGIHDNDRRLADHFGGKLHLGFITIREHLDDLKKVIEEKQQEEKEEEEEEEDVEYDNSRNENYFREQTFRTRYPQGRKYGHNDRYRSYPNDKQRHTFQPRHQPYQSSHFSSYNKRSRNFTFQDHKKSRDYSSYSSGRSYERKHYRSNDRYS